MPSSPDLPRIRLEDLRASPRPLPQDALDRCTRALRAAAARLDVDLGAGPAPLPTWTVMLMDPSRMGDLYRSFGHVLLPGQVVLDLTWPAGTAVANLDELTWLCHGAGHWLAHHRLGVSCADSTTWRASERLARRAEGPGWIARLFGRGDPGAVWV